MRLDRVTPDQGPTEGGTRVRLEGVGFLAGLSARFGEVPGADLVVVSDQVATVVAPAGAFGAVDVALTQVDGAVSTLAAAFHYFWTTFSFQAPSVHGLSGTAEGLALADLNGDGVLDAATANFSSNQVDVLLGNGNGTFAARTSFPVPNNPARIVAADFNGDGVLDLAATRYNAGNVAVLIGVGDGTFAGQVSYPMEGGGTQLVGLKAVDMDGDGTLDLVGAHRSGGNRVAIWIGRGDGTFADGVAYGTITGAYELAVADFDADGDMDVAVASLSGTVMRVMWNNGDGTLAAGGTDLETGGAMVAVVARDFDGDGDADLAATRNGGNYVAVVLNNGDGSFAGQQQSVIGATLRGLTAADINGDGIQDLLVSGSSGLYPAFGNGDGTFVPLAVSAGFSRSYAVEAVDLNGDGHPEGLTVGNSLQVGIGVGQ